MPKFRRITGGPLNHRGKTGREGPNTAMIHTAIIVFWLSLRLSGSGETTDGNRPLGRVALAVAGENEESAFHGGSAPGPGKRIVVYAEASSPCVMLVAAFTTKDRKLAHGWRPAIVQLAEWSEKELPEPPVTWPWPAAPEPFEFYVLFLNSTTHEMPDIARLVSLLDKPDIEARLLQLQTSKLRELIDQLIADRAPSLGGPREEKNITGIFRNGTFPWRDFHRSANFSAARPGIIVYSWPTRR
jgi:hypothetical protein